MKLVLASLECITKGIHRMEIKAYKSEAFLKSFDSSNYIAALIYGPDTGMVSHRAKLIAENIVPDINDPFNAVDINVDNMKENPSIINDEFYAISFTGGRKLIRILNASGISNSNIIKDAITNFKDEQASSNSNFILVTAGDLKKTSPLRKIFEKNSNTVALPCFSDDIQNISAIISAELRRHNLVCNSSDSQEINQYIAANCLGDRMIVISEIAKLSIYKGEDHNVTIGDVKASIAINTASSHDDICNAAASGNQALLQHHLRKSLSQGDAPITILRALQRYYSRLHQVIAYTEQGLPQNDAMKKLRPPVFFKQETIMRTHLRMLNNGNRLSQASNLLYQAELSCKKTGSYPELMCSRSLMKIASLGRRK